MKVAVVWSAVAAARSVMLLVVVQPGGGRGVPQSEVMEVLVLVKAAPVMTSELEETMCVAGVRIDGGRNEWVRLHPVPFRDLADETRFAKYQRITVRCIRHKTDRRPETWTPIQGSIVVGEAISSAKGWERRRPYIEPLGEMTTCELVARNRENGSGLGVPSLAVVRPVEPPALLVDQRDVDQLKQWRDRAEASVSSPSLFDDPISPKPPFEVVPWRFRYRYRCAAPSCGGHNQTIVDWEAVSLWRHVRQQVNWEDAMRTKFERQLWTDKDSVLFVGNMEQYPWNFLVLGIFWPPSEPTQRTLL